MKKDNFQGFTLIELIVVIGLAAILLIVALAGFNDAKQRTRDDIRISDIQKIRAALHQYHTSCGVYPHSLTTSANNARVGTCHKSLGDFLSTIPVPPNSSASEEKSSYMYVGLSTSLNGPCYEYHVAAILENTNSRALNDDHDYSTLPVSAPFRFKCAGSGDPLVNTDVDEKFGVYDFRSSNSN